MCNVKVLVVGRSKSSNHEVVSAIERGCREESGGEAVVEHDEADPSAMDVDPGDYDVVAVEDGVIPLECGKSAMCSETPVISFSEVSGRGRLFSSAVANAVARGFLRDKIDSVTEQISETSRLLSIV